MIIFALTDIALDLTLGVAWWLVKNTVYCTYCAGSYFFYTTHTEEDNNEILELKFQMKELSKQLERISSQPQIYNMNASLPTPITAEPIKNIIEPIKTDSVNEFDDSFEHIEYN